MKKILLLFLFLFSACTEILAQDEGEWIIGEWVPADTGAVFSFGDEEMYHFAELDFLYTDKTPNTGPGGWCQKPSYDCNDFDWALEKGKMEIIVVMSSGGYIREGTQFSIAFRYNQEKDQLIFIDAAGKEYVYKRVKR